jgi:hypothetical protein
MDRIKKRHVEVIRQALSEYTWTDVTDEESKSKVDPKSIDFVSLIATGPVRVKKFLIGDPKKSKITEVEWRQSAGRSIILQMADTTWSAFKYLLIK